MTNDENFIAVLNRLGVTKTPVLATIDGGAAFAGFLSFSMNKDAPDFIDEFRKESGLQIILQRTGLDKMVDDACGLDMAAENKKTLAAYIDWLIVNHWGEEGVADVGAAA